MKVLHFTKHQNEYFYLSNVHFLRMSYNTRVQIQSWENLYCFAWVSAHRGMTSLRTKRNLMVNISPQYSTIVRLHLLHYLV